MSSEARKEQYRIANAQRAQRAEYKDAQAQRYAAWYAANGKDPSRLARKAKKMREYARNPNLAERTAARRAVRCAIQSGQLARLPCEVCGDHKTHGHHDDYGKPLNVRWLCPAHHREHHARATGGAP